MYGSTECPCTGDNYKRHWLEHVEQCKRCEGISKFQQAQDDWLAVYRNLSELNQENDLNLKDLIDVMDSVIEPMLEKIQEEVGA